MKARLVALTATIVLSSCNDNSTNADEPGKMVPPRSISSSLQASCKPIVTALVPRAAAGEVDVQLSALGKVDLFAYDTAGGLVSHSLTPMKLPPTRQELDRLVISLDGRYGDDYLPTGHYFLFWSIQDSLGTTLKQDSACYGWSHPSK